MVSQAQLKVLTKSTNENWCTPEELLKVVEAMSPIGLDPCGNISSIVRAKKILLPPNDDGLAQPWINQGLVFVNPPYGRKIKYWLRKAVVEAARGAEIAMLIPARTDTVWFQQWVFGTARAICFWKGRLRFVGAQHPAPFPSAIVYWGNNVDNFRGVFYPHGSVVVL